MRKIILSAVINKAAQMAIASGNQVSEISEGWEKVIQVVHMSRPLTDGLRATLQAEAELRYWIEEPTPHNKAEEGFTCDRDRVAITFPC